MTYQRSSIRLRFYEQGIQTRCGERVIERGSGHGAAHTPVSLTFLLDTGSGVPVYRQIIQQVENAVLSGRVKAGDRLPTIRALSVELKINPNTISKAYNELEIRGMTHTQVGSGTYISEKKPAIHDEWKEKKVRDAVCRFLREMDELGVDRAEVIAAIKEGIA